MNDSVALAREGFPARSDYDLQKMLLELIAKGAEAKLCKTCITRCGIATGQVRPEVKIGTMPELSQWVQTSDKVLSF
jgi:uncharacterized protein involved in oxidation of intracellular sulfur